MRMTEYWQYKMNAVASSPCLIRLTAIGATAMRKPKIVTRAGLRPESHRSRTRYYSNERDPVNGKRARRIWEQGNRIKSCGKGP